MVVVTRNATGGNATAASRNVQAFKNAGRSRQAVMNARR